MAKFGAAWIFVDVWSCNSQGRPCEWPFCDTSSERGTFLWQFFRCVARNILASSRTYPKNPWKTNWVCFFYACNCNSQNNKPLKAWDRSFTYRYFCCWWLKGWKGCCDRRSICRVMRVPLNDSGWKAVGVSPSSICPVNIYDRYLNTPRIMQKTVLIWGPWALF